MFQRLPIELVESICGYLTVADLLLLARASKHFYQLAKASGYLWKAAVLHIGNGSLQPSPSDAMAIVASQFATRQSASSAPSSTEARRAFKRRRLNAAPTQPASQPTFSPHQDTAEPELVGSPASLHLSLRLLNRLAPCLRNVRRLTTACFEDASNHQVMLLAPFLPSLTIVDLPRNSSLTDDAMSILTLSCPTIKSLNLDRCRGLTPKSMRLIAERLACIETLNCSGTRVATTRSLLSLFEQRSSTLRRISLANCCWVEWDIVLLGDGHGHRVHNLQDTLAEDGGMAAPGHDDGIDPPSTAPGLLGYGHGIKGIDTSRLLSMDLSWNILITGRLLVMFANRRAADAVACSSHRPASTLALDMRFCDDMVVDDIKAAEAVKDAHLSITHNAQLQNHSVESIRDFIKWLYSS
ncbi:hypothetical protein BC831DRAFT_447478 [Entophlyctis helioformis]|nr:hypothetical protein BC831DRAFT_447478 [Entophlyctis helioformis]